MELSWSAGEWTHPPVTTAEDGDDLLVTAAEGSDAWRITSYGFVHDSEHALLAPFPAKSRGSRVHRLLLPSVRPSRNFCRCLRRAMGKAGVEFADGRPHIGAVVTDGRSDWSLAPRQRGWTGASSSGSVGLPTRSRSGPSPTTANSSWSAWCRSRRASSPLQVLHLRSHASRPDRSIPRVAHHRTRPQPPLTRPKPGPANASPQAEWRQEGG